MNWSAQQAKVARALAKLGAVARVTRLGSLVCAGSGVFEEIKQEDIKASGLPGVSNAATTSGVFLMSAKVSKAPQVGDTLTTTSGEFQIERVEVVSPAGTPLLYRLGVR